MLLLQNPKPQPLMLVDKPVVFQVSSKKAIEENKKRQQLVGDLIALKNARHENDHIQSQLFLLVGLTISLGLCLLAFEWKTYEPSNLINLGSVSNDFEEILDIPPTEQAPPPPPQKIMAPVFQVVADEIELKEIDIHIDAETNERDIIQEVVFEEVMLEPEEEKVDEIFDIVETPAAPVGGMEAFYTYVAENMKYPASAIRLGVSGKVFVQFVIEKDGSITDVKVLKGIEKSCDDEAVRVVKNAPKWHPAKQRGRPVRMYQRLPIVFVYRENN